MLHVINFGENIFETSSALPQISHKLTLPCSVFCLVFNSSRGFKYNWSALGLGLGLSFYLGIGLGLR